MNVWQTLDLIAGTDLRKRFDGGGDVNSFLKVIAKRDSFSKESPNDKGGTSDEEVLGFMANTSRRISAGRRKSVIRIRESIAAGRNSIVSSPTTKPKRKKKKIRKKKYFRYGEKKQAAKVEENLPEDYDIVIDCSFNVPKISARLERLMGTNVVRLTDRKYMKELRQRLADDYISTLAKRIQIRELKELERERTLILDGKTDEIPDELAEHPIFLVDKKVSVVVGKRRSMMKTGRERHAERIRKQASKWDKEREAYEKLGQQKEEEIQRLKQQQKELEEKYMEEDAKRGMDLLRIHDTEYHECELGLKNFLETERQKMAVKYYKEPKQYINDPLDIVNIVQRRQKFRELEKTIRSKIEQKGKGKGRGRGTSKAKLALVPGTPKEEAVDSDAKSRKSKKKSKSKKSHGRHDDDDISVSKVQIIPISQNVIQFWQSLQPPAEPVKEGEEAPPPKTAQMQYEDPKVGKLKLTNTIRQLYFLAEEIITGEEMEVEEEGEEGEEGEEEA